MRTSVFLTRNLYTDHIFYTIYPITLFWTVLIECPPMRSEIPLMTKVDKEVRQPTSGVVGNPVAIVSKCRPPFCRDVCSRVIDRLLSTTVVMLHRCRSGRRDWRSQHSWVTPVKQCAPCLCLRIIQELWARLENLWDRAWDISMSHRYSSAPICRPKKVEDGHVLVVEL